MGSFIWSTQPGGSGRAAAGSSCGPVSVSESNQLIRRCEGFAAAFSGMRNGSLFASCCECTVHSASLLPLTWSHPLKLQVWLSQCAVPAIAGARQFPLAEEYAHKLGNGGNDGGAELLLLLCCVLVLPTFVMASFILFAMLPEKAFQPFVGAPSFFGCTVRTKGMVALRSGGGVGSGGGRYRCVVGGN